MSEDKELQVFEELKRPMAMGEVFAKSGMFPDVKSQSQAVVKILAGKELGLSPFEAMGSIYIVNGKLAVSAKAMAGLIKRSKNYDYKVDKIDDKECTISLIGKNEIGVNGDSIVGRSTFTFADAAKAGLVNKDVWKNYPRNMLFARAISNLARWYCPEVISGYYSVEELEDVEEAEIVPHKTTVEVSLDGN